MKKTAIIDVDDTLFNLRDPMCEALNAYTGKNIHHTEWDSYDLHGKYGLSLDEFFYALTLHQALENSKPEPECKNFLRTLKPVYSTVLLTARGWHPYGGAITKGVLLTHGIGWLFIECLNLGECKADHIKNYYGDVGLFVEDNPKHFDSVLKQGLSEKCFLIERPWNADYRNKNPDLANMFVKSLDDIGKLI